MSILSVVTGLLQSYCTHCVSVRGQVPKEPRPASLELVGTTPSLSAESFVSPEAWRLEGLATTARLTGASSAQWGEGIDAVAAMTAAPPRPARKLRRLTRGRESSSS